MPKLNVVNVALINTERDKKNRSKRNHTKKYLDDDIDKILMVPAKQESLMKTQRYRSQLKAHSSAMRSLNASSKNSYETDSFTDSIDATPILL